MWDRVGGSKGLDLKFGHCNYKTGRGKSASQTFGCTEQRWGVKYVGSGAFNRSVRRIDYF